MTISDVFDIVQKWLDAGKPIAAQVHGECCPLCD